MVSPAFASGAPEKAHHGATADSHESESAVGDAHEGAHHVPTWGDINWITGFLGEKDGVEPGLLWRAPGTPIPLGALILNTAILFFLIGRLGGPGIKQGLVDRKARIAGEIEKASEMKSEAEKQLAHYEEKLSLMESEMQRIKDDMKTQAKVDRERILAEATARRVHIESEARQLIEQELATARHDATVKAVHLAVEAARAEIIKSLDSKDHERLAKSFLGSLDSHIQKSPKELS